MLRLKISLQGPMEDKHLFIHTFSDIYLVFAVLTSTVSVSGRH